VQLLCVCAQLWGGAAALPGRRRRTPSGCGLSRRAYCRRGGAEIGRRGAQAPAASGPLPAFACLSSRLAVCRLRANAGGAAARRYRLWRTVGGGGRGVAWWRVFARGVEQAQGKRKNIDCAAPRAPRRRHTAGDAELRCWRQPAIAAPQLGP